MTSPMRARTQACADGDSDAGMVLIYVLAFMMFLGTLSLAALSQMTSEVRQNQFSSVHAQTLNTAMAGLSSGLNRIRAAVDVNTGAGVVASLPCTAGTSKGSMTGTIDAAGLLTYTTDFYYLTVDPTSMTAAQVAAAAMTCPLSAVPSYAYVLATGAQAPLPGRDADLGDRSVHGVYTFTTSKSTRYGGAIRTNNGLCWDVGTSPVDGSPITLQTCLGAGASPQQLYFRPDQTIQWMGDPTANLCLDYRGVAATPRDSLMTLRTCFGSGTAGTAYDAINQVYSPAAMRYQEFNLGNWLMDVGATGDSSSSNAIVSSTPGTGVLEQRLIGDRMAMSSIYSNTSFLTLANSVGAGGAGGITNGLPSISEQLVNYRDQQNCLDVAGGNPANGLISFPCHQSPDPSKVTWNQRFQYSGTISAPGTVTTGCTTCGWSGDTTFCFDSSGTAVSLVACVAGKGSQQWQLTGYRSGDYPGSYLLKDFTGKCIAATSGYNTALRTCDGSAAQKWNAPPGGNQTLLQGVVEQ